MSKLFIGSFVLLLGWVLVAAPPPAGAVTVSEAVIYDSGLGVQLRAHRTAPAGGEPLRALRHSGVAGGRGIQGAAPYAGPPGAVGIAAMASQAPDPAAAPVAPARSLVRPFGLIVGGRDLAPLALGLGPRATAAQDARVPTVPAEGRAWRERRLALWGAIIVGLAGLGLLVGRRRGLRMWRALLHDGGRQVPVRVVVPAAGLAGGAAPAFAAAVARSPAAPRFAKLAGTPAAGLGPAVTAAHGMPGIAASAVTVPLLEEPKGAGQITASGAPANRPGPNGPPRPEGRPAEPVPLRRAAG